MEICYVMPAEHPAANKKKDPIYKQTLFQSQIVHKLFYISDSTAVAWTHEVSLRALGNMCVQNIYV